MVDEFGQENVPVVPPSEPEVVVLIKKMQQQLVFLEKKIDTLIAQSQAKPFSAERSFPKPFRSYSHPPHRPDRPRDNYSQDKGSDRGRRFEGRGNEEGHGSGYKKKPYDHSRGGSSFGPERHSEKRHGEDKPWFAQKKKAFPFKRRRP